MKVFDSQQADGVSATFKNLGGSTGRVNIYISGVLGDGVIWVEACTPDGEEWVRVTGGEILNPGLYVIDSGYFVGRLNLSGSADAGISAWVVMDDGAEKLRVMQQ